MTAHFCSKRKLFFVAIDSAIIKPFEHERGRPQSINDFYKLLRCSGVNSKLSDGTQKQLNYVCGAFAALSSPALAAPLEFPI